ncbi:MAG: manganese efflux pump [Clostridia bacterium]|nr:manganese efflux pump [Clostridia bacterium]
MNAAFFLTAISLGAGLAMDAFSVSMANGLHEPRMKTARMSLIAGIFALCQAAMPMLGWAFVHTLVEFFEVFHRFIPFIALALLLFIGGKMLIEGIRCNKSCEEGGSCDCGGRLGVGALLIQGVATSIDALSVGFTIADYNLPMAAVSATVIALVTFIICMAGLEIGKRFGTRLSGKAGILGGAVLILIGFYIFIKGIL